MCAESIELEGIMNVAIVVGSIRKESYNMKLAEYGYSVFCRYYFAAAP